MFLTRKVYLGTCAKGQHFFKNGTEWVVLDRNGEFLTCQNTTTPEQTALFWAKLKENGYTIRQNKIVKL